MYCDQCGKANRPEARFCQWCGAPLQDVDSEPARASTGVPETSVQPPSLPSHSPLFDRLRRVLVANIKSPRVFIGGIAVVALVVIATAGHVVVGSVAAFAPTPTPVPTPTSTVMRWQGLLLPPGSHLFRDDGASAVFLCPLSGAELSTWFAKYWGISLSYLGPVTYAGQTAYAYSASRTGTTPIYAWNVVSSGAFQVIVIH